MELNREQIIKALECCNRGTLEDCAKCPRFDDDRTLSTQDCMECLMRDALSLIKELAEEKEKLGFLIDEIVREKRELFEEKTLLESQYETMYDTIEGNIRGEIAECENSCDWCKGKVKADTVRKMQERLYRELAYLGAKDKLNKEYFLTEVDRVAKEMVEGV